MPLGSQTKFAAFDGVCVASGGYIGNSADLTCRSLSSECVSVGIEWRFMQKRWRYPPPASVYRITHRRPVLSLSRWRWRL